MPVFEPGGMIAIILDCDHDKPHPPTFIVRALSARESLKLTSTLDEIMSSGTQADQVSRLEQIIKEHVIDWRNFPVSFDAEKLLDVLGVTDLWRLGYSIARQIGPVEKKSEAGGAN